MEATISNGKIESKPLPPSPVSPAGVLCAVENFLKFARSYIARNVTESTLPAANMYKHNLTIHELTEIVLSLDEKDQELRRALLQDELWDAQRRWEANAIEMYRLGRSEGLSEAQDALKMFAETFVEP